MEIERFKPIYNLNDAFYNINLHLDLLFKLTKYLCPITRQKDLEYVLPKFNEIYNITKILKEHYLYRSFELIKQLQSEEKVKSYHNRIDSYFWEIKYRWRKYYNDDIFKKAHDFNLFWNECKLKHIVFGVDSEILNFENALNSCKSKDNQNVINNIDLSDTNTTKNNIASYKHTHIFKNNAFDVWEAMFNDFGIKESSRTDIKFMFEEMKKDGLIFNTITQKNILNWISETYQIEIEKTSNYSKTKARISIYSNAKHLYQR